MTIGQWSFVGSFTSNESIGSVAVLAKDASCAIPVKDNREASPVAVLPRRRTNRAVSRFPALPLWIVPRSLRSLRIVSAAGCSFSVFSPITNKTSPLRIQPRSFGSKPSQRDSLGLPSRCFARCRRGFPLQTVTSFHRPRLIHYYGFICHLTSHRSLLELPLDAALPASHASPMGELTRPAMMPGFPSYCTGSLTMMTSPSTPDGCSCIGHHVFLHARPRR